MVAETETDHEEPRIDCPVLVTERLVMRPPHAIDVPDLVALANDRRVAAMLMRMPHPYGEAEANAFIAASAAGRAGAVYALTLAENGRFVGCAALTPADGELELGYWLGHPYWGRGLATEAAHALVDLGFRASDVAALRASCRVVNPGSRRVIQKCGFQFSGQGMLRSLVAGQVAVERYRLDRRTWISLRTWAARDPAARGSG